MTYAQTLSNKLRNNIDMLTGCWNRVHVSDDAQEIDTVVKAAKSYAREIMAAKVELIKLDEDWHKDHPRKSLMPTVPEGTEDSFEGCMKALKITLKRATLPFYANIAIYHIKEAAKERKAVLESHAAHPEYEQYK